VTDVLGHPLGRVFKSRSKKNGLSAGTPWPMKKYRLFFLTA
jgi:hypothetical protein